MAKQATIAVRRETPGDRDAIHDLTRRAFTPMPYSDGGEPDLVDALREAGALSLSLVAEQAGRIVGHIAFSPAFPADAALGWYALGPVSAEPELQRGGIGSALIEAGLSELRARDAAGCVLVGDPAYYRRFGFEQRPDLCPDGEPAEYFQMLELAGPVPGGPVGFHPLFHAAPAKEEAA